MRYSVAIKQPRSGSINSGRDFMAITACVKRNVQQNSAGCATVFGSRRRSWSELQERVARVAGGMKLLGLGAGDRIAILALNSDRYLEYYIAVPWADGVVVAAQHPLGGRRDRVRTERQQRHSITDRRQISQYGGRN
jgi:acyl-CoA synthetase (AMP-forming)/AMP-acid ligase II